MDVIGFLGGMISHYSLGVVREREAGKDVEKKRLVWFLNVSLFFYG